MTIQGSYTDEDGIQGVITDEDGNIISTSSSSGDTPNWLKPSRRGSIELPPEDDSNAILYVLGAGILGVAAWLVLKK